MKGPAGLSLVQVARSHLVALAGQTEDTVHLGIIDNGRALYLDKIPGQRRIEISSRIGERQPLYSTGLGKALLLDSDEATLRAAFAREGGKDVEPWLVRMHGYARDGHAFDLEENEDRIRCVAAPIRNASGRITGAISLSSLRQYMDDIRMRDLTGSVRDTADAISRALGWPGPS